MTSEKTPYLSFVVTSRNDNHGGDLLRRMQLFVTGLLAQCKRFNLPSELIIVEWNPPSDRPPLVEALKWPAEAGPCEVRIITVPPEIHCRFKYSDKLPLFQMIAKNVGIRRARGQFVLATNIDVLFSDELMRFLARAKLDPDKSYRLDRWDVRADIPDDAPLEEQLEFCRYNILRVNMQKGTITDPKEIRVAQRLSKAGLHYHGTLVSLLRFRIRVPNHGTLASLLRFRFHVPKRIKSLWDRLSFWFRMPVHIPQRIQPLWDWLSFWFRMPVGRRLKALVTPKYWRRIFVWSFAILFPPRNHIASGKKNPKINIMDRYPLHSNACGDFTLLSKQRWFRICGYPEWEVYSFHLDTLGLYAARIDGAARFF